MQLYVFDEKKRTQYKFKENEGLQFMFDIESDKSEEVVQQMIEQQHIPDIDTKMIIKLIKDKASFRFFVLQKFPTLYFPKIIKCFQNLKGQKFR